MRSVSMKTVLVIDHDLEVRSVIAATLNYADYAVRQARNGREGILMVLDQRPDLILCDVRVPEMDGYRTLAAIRNFHGTADIPFILMTGVMRREELRRAVGCAANDYLIKPFSALELIQTVETTLDEAQRGHQESLAAMDNLGSLPSFLSKSIPSSALMSAAT